MTAISHPAVARAVTSLTRSQRVPVFLIGDSTLTGTSSQLGWMHGVSKATTDIFPCVGTMIVAGRSLTSLDFYGSRTGDSSPAPTKTILDDATPPRATPDHIQTTIPASDANHTMVPHFYAYHADFHSISASSVNKNGLRIQPAHPIGIETNALRITYMYSTETGGTGGSIRPTVHSSSQTSSVNALALEAAALTTSGTTDSTPIRSLTASGPSLVGDTLEFRHVPRAGSAAQTLEGPVAILWMSFDNPALSNGVAVSPLLGDGGWSTQTVLETLQDSMILDAPIEGFLSFAESTHHMESNGACLVEINLGANDVNETGDVNGNSIGPNPTSWASDPAGAFSDNLQGIITSLRARHAANGKDPDSMYFSIAPHPPADPPNATVESFRAAAAAVAGANANVFAVDYSALITGAAITANSWRQDATHYTQAGYEGLAALKWGAIAGGGFPNLRIRRRVARIR